MSSATTDHLRRLLQQLQQSTAASSSVPGSVPPPLSASALATASAAIPAVAADHFAYQDANSTGVVAQTDFSQAALFAGATQSSSSVDVSAALSIPLNPSLISALRASLSANSTTSSARLYDSAPPTNPTAWLPPALDTSFSVDQALPTLAPLPSNVGLRDTAVVQPIIAPTRFTPAVLRTIADACEDNRCISTLKSLKFAQAVRESALVGQRKGILEKHERLRNQSYAELSAF
ncbi:hypothetical protein HDU83_008668 [Entophlyctis luteolus]|nr:hypothetical protein HDU83_008668 [Entophlyctis luteolus]